MTAAVESRTLDLEPETGRTRPELDLKTPTSISFLVMTCVHIRDYTILSKKELHRNLQVDFSILSSASSCRLAAASESHDIEAFLACQIFREALGVRLPSPSTQPFCAQPFSSLVGRRGWSSCATGLGAADKEP